MFRAELASVALADALSTCTPPVQKEKNQPFDSVCRGKLNTSSNYNLLHEPGLQLYQKQHPQAKSVTAMLTAFQRVVPAIGLVPVTVCVKNAKLLK